MKIFGKLYDGRSTLLNFPAFYALNIVNVYIRKRLKVG